MAWYEGAMLNQAGSLKDILDVKLPLNPYWHIEDADAGANIGVYHNYDPDRNSNFILVAKDNQADFTTIEFWEAWDSVGHAGVGQSLVNDGTYTYRIRKGTAYGLSIKDHNMKFVGTINWRSYYIGQLKGRVGNRNMPIFIGHTSNTGDGNYGANPIGVCDSGAARWRALFDENGLLATLSPYTRLSSYIVIRNVDGEFRLMEHPVYNMNNSRDMGILEGVVYMYNTSNGLENGDIVRAQDGTPWIAVGSAVERWCLIEEA